MTDVALKEYLERRLNDLEKRVDQRFEDFDRRFNQHFSLNDRAIAKAETTMNERLNSMNEFRDALKDQSGRMATRIEVEKIDSDVQELRRAKANLDGRLVVLAGGISLVVSIALWGLTQVLK